LANKTDFEYQEMTKEVQVFYKRVHDSKTCMERFEHLQSILVNDIVTRNEQLEESIDESLLANEVIFLFSHTQQG